MPDVRNFLNPRAAYVLPEDIRVRRSDESIIVTPDDQGRRGDTPQPPLKPVFRDGEQELGGGACAARHADQKLDLLLAAIVLVAEQLPQAEHQLGRGAVQIVE